ncbi:MAG: HEAT repeat domain-containing protein [Terriglobia bacterium]
MMRLFVTLLALSLGLVQAAPDVSPFRKPAQNESSDMNSTATLESLLESANWDAVDHAQREGPAALPTIRQYARSKNYRTRQISVACAARIGGNEAAAIVAGGLIDDNVNVQLQAAKELSSGKFPSAAQAVLEQLSHGQEYLVREFLALAAGYIPGSQAVAILRPLAEGKGTLATNARMALCRLGDERALSELIKDLSSSSPRTRYESLDQLRYVANPKLIPYAKRLLSDKEPAVRIGLARHPRFRRVCDQAVDTLVFLLQLHPPFRVAAEQIYTDEELRQVRDLMQ